MRALSYIHAITVCFLLIFPLLPSSVLPTLHYSIHTTHILHNFRRTMYLIRVILKSSLSLELKGTNIKKVLHEFVKLASKMKTSATVQSQSSGILWVERRDGECCTLTSLIYKWVSESPSPQGLYLRCSTPNIPVGEQLYLFVHFCGGKYSRYL